MENKKFATKNSDVWIIDTDYSYDDQIALSFLTKHLNVIAITLCHRSPYIDLYTLKEKVKSDLRKINKENIEIFVGSTNPYVDYVKELNDDEIMDPYNCQNMEDLSSYEELAKKNKAIIDEENQKDSTEFISNIAAVKIIEYINLYGKNLNILSLGPLTNLSLAIILDVKIKDAFNNLFVMGGSIYNYGNSGTCSEYNFRCDPVAAKNVIGNYKNLRLLSLEIDHKLKENNKLLLEEISELKKKTDKERNYFIGDYNKFLENFFRVYSRDDEDENFHESLFGLIASLFVINPALIDLKLAKYLPSDVDIFGRKTRGCIMIQNYDHLVDGKFNNIDLISDFDMNLFIKTLKDYLI